MKSTDVACCLTLGIQLLMTLLITTTQMHGMEPRANAGKHLTALIAAVDRLAAVGEVVAVGRVVHQYLQMFAFHAWSMLEMYCAMTHTKSKRIKSGICKSM
jgi:hypothetical protein